MARSKAQERLVLVKHQPGKARKRIVYTVFAVVMAAALGYSSSSLMSRHALDTAVASLDRLSEEHRKLIAEEAQLRQTVANLESGRAIDDLAKQQIQDTIAGLRDDLASLEKDLAFYRNIMAPSDNARGLQVQSAELKAMSDKQRYAYKIVLAQVADNKSYVSGVVAVNLIGMRDDKQEVIPLRDVSELEDLGIKFRFRYFQNIAGELVLPEAFEPAQIQVVAQSKGKKSSRIEQSFEWQSLLN